MRRQGQRLDAGFNPIQQRVLHQQVVDGVAAGAEFDLRGVEDGEEATILSIEYSGNFPPGSVRPAIQDADLDGLSTDQWAGIEMLRISPRELLARDDFVGTIEEEVAGYTVTTACDDASQDAHLTGVLTVVDAGDEGADISHYTIRYEAGGREHEVSSSWQYVACGTRTQDVEGC